MRGTRNAFAGRLTFANVASAVALFIAIGGASAWAGGLIGGAQIKSNAIHSRHIKNGQVKNADIHKGAVSRNKLNADALASGGIYAAHFTVPHLSTNETTFAAVNGNADTGPEASVATPTPSTHLVLSDFYLNTGDPGTGGDSRTYTLRLNGNDTAISCTFDIHGGTCTPDTTLSVPAHSTLSLKMSDIGGTSSNSVQGMVAFRLSPAG